MTGPSHYREAEKCLERARGVDFDHAAYLHREAQVHAMLALAAATLDAAGYGTEIPHEEQWREALS